MIKTQEQYRELLEARLQQLDEFNFGSSRLLRGLAAGGLALANLAGMQFAAMHVTPQEASTTQTTTYSVPVSGQQLNQAQANQGKSAEQQDFGNFPAHSYKSSLTHLHGYQQGQQIPHSVRGFFDLGNRTETGAAAKTVLPGVVYSRNVTTNTGQQFNAYQNSRTGVESGQRLPFSTQNAGLFNTQVGINSTGQSTGSGNAPTPSVFGSGLAGAGLLAGGLGAVALAQRAVRRGGAQQPPPATPTTSGGLQSPPPR